MRKTTTVTNAHGGSDFHYSIVCDICGRPLMKSSKRITGPAEFLTCGEETLSAQAAGWIVVGNLAICAKCLASIGE